VYPGAKHELTFSRFISKVFCIGEAKRSKRGLGHYPRPGFHEYCQEIHTVFRRSRQEKSPSYSRPPESVENVFKDEFGSTGKFSAAPQMGGFSKESCELL